MFRWLFRWILCKKTRSHLFGIEIYGKNERGQPRAVCRWCGFDGIFYNGKLY